MSKTSLSQLTSEGQYARVIESDAGRTQIHECLEALVKFNTMEAPSGPVAVPGDEELAVATASLNAFLQANVTGPVLADQPSIEEAFLTEFRSVSDDSIGTLRGLRKRCLDALTVDGVAPYPYIPLLELFFLARHVFTAALGAKEDDIKLRWNCLRVHTWHYKLLTQPSLGGSAFTKSAQWSDVPSLQELILSETSKVESAVLADDSKWTQDQKVEFLLEKSSSCVLLGLDSVAKVAVEKAAETSGFVYALSGALGKRTKWQEKSISQLVVLAKSGAASAKKETEEPKPEAVLLNDDTLLEEIQFNKAQKPPPANSVLPVTSKALAEKPDEQPQLTALDQIILLSDATVKDAFSPVDTLTAVEVLPFATRVLSDKSTNWQVYTQALLVRSRIEVHRSRTVERGVLQMQAVVDQVVADTSRDPPPTPKQNSDLVLPTISVSSDGQQAAKPTSFLPAPKASESAPPQDRLQYIHALFSPPKWHLESELAYAWAGVGSFISALEIFKRLKLWAEVAICLASAGVAGQEDADGRGSGGDEKARGVLRWRLFQRTVTEVGKDEGEQDEVDVDADRLKAADFMGPEKIPQPPNAPRLWCILGDIENEPKHYERAWELSRRRYARAQKSLGEHYLSQRDFESARQAYEFAVGVNRLSPELWSRLGDINLRLARFADAAEAFSRAIGAAGDVAGGEDARTWSNLGSALWSLCCEVMEERQTKDAVQDDGNDGKSLASGDAREQKDDVADGKGARYVRDPVTLLAQSLNAYKRGASIANDNWRIWDNVVTLASRMRPTPAYTDMIQATRQVLRIRNTEAAVDADVLRTLLSDLVLTKEITVTEGETYAPPRGSLEKAVLDLLEDIVVPLITTRDDLWELVSRARVWRRDYAGAVDAAEKAWRAAMSSSSVGVGVGTTLSPSAAGGADASGTAYLKTSDGAKKQHGPWTEDPEAWGIVVRRTDELVAVMENYGPRVTTIGTRWKSKARMAVRSVMGKGKERWEGTEDWKTLEGVMEGLK